MRETSSLMRWYRFGNACYRHHIPVIPSIVNRLIRILYSCDIPVQTKIGNGSKFVHSGLGVVVNPEAIIGKNVIIYQNVSIAGRCERGTPIIEDGVFIGCNACILGGVRIGKGAEIGAGAVVIDDIPDFAVAVGIPAKVIKIKRDR